jgi:hypothetical protein
LLEIRRSPRCVTLCVPWGIDRPSPSTGSLIRFVVVILL